MTPRYHFHRVPCFFDFFPARATSGILQTKMWETLATAAGGAIGSFAGTFIGGLLGERIREANILPKTTEGVDGLMLLGFVHIPVTGAVAAVLWYWITGSGPLVPVTCLTVFFFVSFTYFGATARRTIWSTG